MTLSYKVIWGHYKNVPPQQQQQQQQQQQLGPLLDLTAIAAGKKYYDKKVPTFPLFQLILKNDMTKYGYTPIASRKNSP